MRLLRRLADPILILQGIGAAMESWALTRYGRISGIEVAALIINVLTMIERLSSHKLGPQAR